MRGLIALLLVVPALIAQEDAPLGPGEIIDGVAHRVNGTVITRSDLERRVGGVLAAAGRPQDIEQVIQRVILDKLKAQAAKDLGISITEEELDRQVDWIVRRRHGGDVSNLLQALSADGLSLSDFRDQKEEELRIHKFYRSKGFQLQDRGGLTRPRSAFDFDVTVTELRRFYRENPDAPECSVPLRVRPAWVHLPDQEGETVAEARERAEAWRERLVSEGLAALADELQERFGEQAVVLDLGLQPLSEYRESDSDLYSAVRSLALGEWSEPVRREGAFELFTITERQPARRLSFSEAQPRIRATIEEQKLTAAENQVLEELILQTDAETRRLLLTGGRLRRR